MRRLLLLSLFLGLLVDGMFGLGLALAPGVSLKNALLYIIMLIMAIELALSGGKVEVELPHLHLLFVLLFFLGFLSWAVNSFVGSHIEYSVLSGAITLKGNLLDHYLFFLAFFVGVRSEQDVLWLQKWLLIVIAAANIATLLDAYNLPDLNVIERRADGRVEGPLGEANQYGLFVAMTLSFLLARTWIERGFLRVFLGAGAAATFLVLLLTVSRGAFASLILGSLFSVVFLRKHMNVQYVKRLFMIGCVAVVGAALVVGQEYASLIAERVQETTAGGDAYRMTSGRVWIWSTALDIMMREPSSILTGYGWNTFRNVMAIAPHNVYLHRFFELGIFGLLIFVTLLVAVLFQARRALDSRSGDGPLVPSLIGFVFGFSMVMVGIFAVDLTNPWYFIWAFVGLAMRGAALMVESPTSMPPATTANADYAAEARDAAFRISSSQPGRRVDSR